MRRVEISDMPALKIAGVDHRGPYVTIGRAFDQLHALFGARSLYGPDQKKIAVYFDDVATTPEAELRAMAGLSVGPQTPVEPPLKTLDLAGGPHAVLRHTGPYAELGSAYAWLYGSWLPRSGRRAADRPAYEIYLNTPMTAAPAELITDICLPLR